MADEVYLFFFWLIALATKSCRTRCILWWRFCHPIETNFIYRTAISCDFGENAKLSRLCVAGLKKLARVISCFGGIQYFKIIDFYDGWKTSGCRQKRRIKIYKRQMHCFYVCCNFTLEIFSALSINCFGTRRYFHKHELDLAHWALETIAYRQHEISSE